MPRRDGHKRRLAQGDGQRRGPAPPAPFCPRARRARVACGSLWAYVHNARTYVTYVRSVLTLPLRYVRTHVRYVRTDTYGARTYVTYVARARYVTLRADVRTLRTYGRDARAHHRPRPLRPPAIWLEGTGAAVASAACRSGRGWGGPRGRAAASVARRGLRRRGPADGDFKIPFAQNGALQDATCAADYFKIPFTQNKRFSDTIRAE